MSFVRTRERVADHGEVFTPAWMVEVMLDLVEDESERIDSRVLEPACGSGNFLVEVLRRRLLAVERKFGRSEFERRHYAVFAVMCVYGIERRRKRSGGPPLMCSRASSARPRGRCSATARSSLATPTGPISRGRCQRVSLEGTSFSVIF